MKLRTDIYNYITNQFSSEKFDCGIILGSGLGYLADDASEKKMISTETIPGYPKSTVTGHAGRIVSGQLNGKKVLFFQGRIHYYEGYSIKEVVIPILISHALGIRKMIITNSAGGLNPNYKPGDLMLIEDHINLMFNNPLIGPVEEGLVRFPDMSSPYNAEWRDMAKNTATRLGIFLHEGTYVGMTGPNYETPHEVKYLRFIGGDAVGMSTVPEVIAARQLNMDVLGISCISNLAAGLSEKPLSHDEVKETADSIKNTFGTLVSSIISEV
ncbi:MAG: purine-nucleoside phosphorylase [Calditrichia bacterium]